MATTPLIGGQSTPSTPLKTEGDSSAGGEASKIPTDNQEDSASFPAIMKRIAPSDKDKQQAPDGLVGMLLKPDGQPPLPQEDDAALPLPGMILPSTLPQDASPERSRLAGLAGLRTGISDRGAASVRGTEIAAAGNSDAGQGKDKLVASQQAVLLSSESQSAKTISPETGVSLHDFQLPKFSEAIIGAHDTRSAAESLMKDLGGAGIDTRSTMAVGSHAAPDVMNTNMSASALLQGGDKLVPDAMAQPISVPLRHPQWGDELSNRITWMVQQEVKSASIKLNPPHLGPLEVKVSLVNDQVNVSFTSHHAPVREALDGSMTRLKEMLGENGLQLGDTNVTHHSFSQQNQTNHQAFSQQGDEGGHYGFDLSENSGADAHQDPLYFVGDGAIDIFA